MPNLITLFQSNAPYFRARRNFWTKVVVVHLWIAAMVGLVVTFEDWLTAHRLAQILFGIFAVTSVIVIGTVWRLTFHVRVATGTSTWQKSRIFAPQLSFQSSVLIAYRICKRLNGISP
jgi:hypothetical protein